MRLLVNVKAFLVWFGLAYALTLLYLALGCQNPITKPLPADLKRAKLETTGHYLVDIWAKPEDPCGDFRSLYDREGDTTSVTFRVTGRICCDPVTQVCDIANSKVFLVEAREKTEKP